MKATNLERVFEVILAHLDQQITTLRRTGNAPCSWWIDHAREDVRRELERLDEDGDGQGRAT